MNVALLAFKSSNRRFLRSRRRAKAVLDGLDHPELARTLVLPRRGLSG
jgi:hypothetical protein